jgi:hypothetical protein
MRLSATLSTTTILAGMMLAAGCNKQADTRQNYEAAINDYYKAHPSCLWSEPKKFPVQAATSDDAKTEGYDALTDAGLLTRTTGEKKVMIVASKQVNNYDLSDKGRTSWAANPNQPGYGNFCFGHRDVTSIDSVTPGKDSAGNKTAQVNYHYKIADVADWANSQEIKTAFPGVGTSLSESRADTASLMQTGDHWQVVGQSTGTGVS